MSFDFTTLITDRTQADVDRVKAIAKKIENGTASESELAEFNSAAMKGAYNYMDLNRVTAAMEALKAKLEGYGYAVPGYRRIKVPHPVTGGGSKLPEGYTELAYIESTGTQYIDTEFKPNQNTRVVIDAQMTSSAVSQFVFGCRTTSYTNNFILLISSANNSFRSGFGSSLVSFPSVTLTDRYEIDHNKTACMLGENLITHAAQTFESTLSMFLCAANEGGSAKYFAKMKLYSCQIFDDDFLVRDYIPCINPAGEVGLYDSVTAAFFGNSGTGSFVAGAVPRKLPEGYAQVEYIQSSGTQYIDTGFVPNQDTSVVTEVLFPTSASVNWLFGARTESLSNSFGFLSVSNYYRADYGANQHSFGTAVSYGSKFVIDFNKNVVTLNGETTGTLATATFSAPKTMVLFGINTNGSITKSTGAKMYSCQIYDNGTLIRDYVPCKNIGGAFGLYDMVNGAFYQNAGSGAFTAGEEIAPPTDVPSEEFDPYLWYEFDWPAPETMTIYLLNVSAIRSVLAVVKSTPSVPVDMVGLMVQEANNIEKILVDVNKLLMKSTQVWFYSGELFAGEV